MSRPLDFSVLSAALGSPAVEVDGGKIAAWFDAPASVLATIGTSVALQSLNEVECDRYAAFRFEQDRLAYLAAHALHRRVWGKVLGVMPHDVHVTHDSNGRPSVVDRDGRSFSTSLSRRRGMVGVAISREASVGVDTEEADARPEARQLLARFLAPASYDSVCFEMGSDTSAFARTWTLVEAFAKVRGSGIVDSLRGIKIFAVGGDRYELADAQMRCSAKAFLPDHRHCAAIAWKLESDGS